MEQKLYIIACPSCHSELLDQNERALQCSNPACQKEFAKIGNIYSFLDSSEKDFSLSRQKWDEYYAKQTAKLQQYIE